MTKKLLALSFVLLLASGVSAQPLVNVWAGGDFDGGPWNSIITTGIDKYVNIDTYVQMNADTCMGNIALPLGIDRLVLDTFIVASSQFHNIFALWDIHQFVNLFDEFHPTNPTPPGFMSLTANGIVNTGSGNSNYYCGMVPTLAWSYNVHTVNDEDLLTTTQCPLSFGWDPTQVANAGDANGNIFIVEWMFACFYFSPNQPPVIDEFELPYDCGYTDFSVPFDVYDQDGDDVTVTSNYGTVTLDGTTPDPLPDEGITYHFILDVDMEAFCGECFTGSIVITADDGNNDPVTFTTDEFTVVGEMTASMDDALYIWPGMEEWMPIYLNTCADCFCLGGFTFTICYGQAAGVIEVTDYMLGDALLGGEFFNVFFGDDFIRFVFINDMNNQQEAPEICAINPQEPILWFKILLDPEPNYPIDFCVPICFCDSDNPQTAFDLNAVSDQSGYATWFSHGCDDPPDSIAFGTLLLNLECGNIKVMNEHNVVYGDLNLNGYPNEVGDAVVYANYLTNPDPEWSLRQKFASDVNRDGYQITIADLIYMINIINGVSGGGKVTPLDAVATVTMPANAYGDMNVMISSDISVGGALVAINHAGVQLGVPTVDGKNLTYFDNGEVMTVAVYDMEAASFAPGANVLFTVPVLTQGDLSFGEVQVADGRGALLDAHTGISAAIPTEFSVSQNFPNPFNAKTSINFGLPTDANVTVSIYNVAGQLVQMMDLGHLNAGNHSVNWDASDVASGVYFYKVAAGDFSKTMKATLLK